VHVKQILVAGGAGGVGEGIVRALLRAGHTVVVPSRSPAKLELLRSRLGAVLELGRLVCVVGHIGDEAGADALRDQFRDDVGRLDVAIASLGGWWEGRRLIDITASEWDELMNEFLRTHFVFARTFIPVLQSQPGGGRYIGIGGGAAYFPVPLATPVSIAAAAQLMLTRALRAELPDPDLDILELVADGPVRTRDSESIAQPDWITADGIGTIVAELAVDGRTTDPFTETNGPILRMRPRAAQLR
jgi:NAD(P)-dependent dehydrogenase (short-subunit alcohol dehydrogenase family)